MAIADIILPALCFNVICFETEEWVSDPFCFDVPCPEEGSEWDIYRQKQGVFRHLVEGLEGQDLFVTTLENGGLSGTKKQNGSVVGTGVAFELLDILKNKYRFNYTVMPPKENNWGSKDSGALGMIVNNKVNLTAAFLPVLADYFNYTTYSPSLDMGVWVAMMKRPRESATGSGLLAPFTFPVWMLILLSVIVVGPVIHLLIRFKAWLCKDDNDTVFSVSSCFWFVYGGLLKQGSTLNPITDSSRILFATWWIFITILTAFYTANLTAFLTLSKFTLPINQAEDVGRKHYRWVTSQGNALNDIIRSENNVPDDQKLKPLGNILGKAYENLDIRNDSKILEDYVQKRDMIFIREKPIVEYVMYEDYKEKANRNVDEEDRCTYVMTKFNITAYPRAFAYSKDFKYKEVFDSAIQHLVEAGIVKFRLSLPLPDTQICPLDLGSKERQLRNADLSLTYVIVGVGFGIAAGIFILEVAAKYVLTRHENKTILFQPREKKTKNETHYGFSRWKEPHFTSNFKTPPPPYHTLFMQNNNNNKRTIVNGREYFVKDTMTGQQLVPVRTPSALLFQYTN